MKVIARQRGALDVADLQLVLALAESGSTVRASTVLHLTQSAVSRGLLAVEDKLGTRLFERQPRGLAPTPAGLRLIGGAGAVLAQLVELEEQVRTGTAGVRPLRVVCECYTAYRWLPATLAQMKSALPAVEISVAIEHTHAPVKALHAGDVDVALLTTGKATSGLVEEPLFRDEIVFVMAAGHALAEKGAIGADDLRRYPMITSAATPDAEHRWFVKHVFGKSAPPRGGLRFPLTEAVIDAARAGMGVAPMSEWVAAPYVAGGELVAKSLRGKRLLRPWRIAYRRESAASAKVLAAALGGAPPRLLTAG